MTDYPTDDPTFDYQLTLWRLLKPQAQQHYRDHGTLEPVVFPADFDAIVEDVDGLPLTGPTPEVTVPFTFPAAMYDAAVDAGYTP